MSGLGLLGAALTGFAGGVGAAMEKDIEREHDEKMRELEHKYRLEEQDHLGEINLKQSEINHQHKLEEQKVGGRIQLRLLQKQFENSKTLENIKNAHELNREALRDKHARDLEADRFEHQQRLLQQRAAVTLGEKAYLAELQAKYNEQLDAAKEAHKRETSLFNIGLGLPPDGNYKTSANSGNNLQDKVVSGYNNAVKECISQAGHDDVAFQRCIARTEAIYKPWFVKLGIKEQDEGSQWSFGSVDLTGNPNALKSVVDRTAEAIRLKDKANKQ